MYTVFMENETGPKVYLCEFGESKENKKSDDKALSLPIESN